MNQYVQSKTGFKIVEPIFKWEILTVRQILLKQKKVYFKNITAQTELHLIVISFIISLSSDITSDFSPQTWNIAFHNLWLIIDLTHFWPQNRPRNWLSWNCTIWYAAKETKYKTPTRILFFWVNVFKERKVTGIKFKINLRSAYVAQNKLVLKYWGIIVAICICVTVSQSTIRFVNV